MSNSSIDQFSKFLKNISLHKPSLAEKKITRDSAQGIHEYKKGDIIGQRCKIIDVLGKGGFGIVYLVHSNEIGGLFALKTFQDEFINDQEVRNRFKKEASVWVELGNHPNLVRAIFVDAPSGRLYIGMEYIAPNEKGLNSLEGYLQSQPPDLVQNLRWSIQICHGLEYAYSKGVRAHRDIKPANIMITQDNVAKITDFGLAGILSAIPLADTKRLNVSSGQTVYGKGFGTPAYMPPEQFLNAASCDVRSDIYSFGVMLYRMATGGKLPFITKGDADWQSMYELHCKSSVPHLNSPLFPIIQHCLEKSPEKRYQSFSQIRENLEPLLQHLSGELIIPPHVNELEAWELSNKGNSLNSLGRFDEAIYCLEKALHLDPQNFTAWNNKGNSLASLGRYEEAIRCFDKALTLNPGYAISWNNKSDSLNHLGRFEQAIYCVDKALEFDPRFAVAWSNKAYSLDRLKQYQEALICWNKALEIDPHFAGVWIDKGNSFFERGLIDEALGCYESCLELDPLDAGAWTNKGKSLEKKNLYDAALRCLDKAIEIDPGFISAWISKGNSLDCLGRHEEAENCFDDALKLDSYNVIALINKGNSLQNSGYYEKAIYYYENALKSDPQNVCAIANKGNTLNNLGQFERGIICLDKALEIDPNYAAAWIYKGQSLDGLCYFKEAINCLDKALKIDQNNASVWENKGRYLDELCLFEEAIYCFDRALEIAPRYYKAWHHKGNSLSSLHRDKEAISCYDMAIKLDPNNSHYWSDKALSQENLGEWREAIFSYQQFIAKASKEDTNLIETVRESIRRIKREKL